MVQGAQLVGSIPLDDAREVFVEVARNLGPHIKRIPDGETGQRSNWVTWQLPLLEQSPCLESVSSEPGVTGRTQSLQLAEGHDAAEIRFDNLGYGDVAISSYQIFSELKRTGVVPAHCRFQVCFPTPAAVSHLFVDSALQAQFEPPYRDALLRELDKVLAAVPHGELAIQWDTAVEFALLEGVMPSWYQDIRGEIIANLLHLAGQVPEPVELGFHLCYGDSGHKHFCEPADMTELIWAANSLASGVERQLNWIHMPVPRDRSDEAYFRPMGELKLRDETELYLGLVHFSDGEEGARARIAAAAKYASNFGLATECGFGRRPKETIEPLMQLHASLADPIG